MNSRRSRSHFVQKSGPKLQGFTLIELLVVLAILATVTTLAVLSIDQVEEQRRFDSAQSVLGTLESAILGSPDDRAADGSYTISGFVADLGRLPRARLGGSGLDLRELWANPLPGSAFDLRTAISAHGVSPVDEDPQVLVAGGWRGPYLRLPANASTLLDPWGNAVSAPFDGAASATGYAHLRDANDSPIGAVGEEIRIVRLLGANGIANDSDVGYDRDEALVLADDRFRAGIAGYVEILDKTGDLLPVNPSQSITIRLFGPDPTDASKIAVIRVTVPFAMNPVVWSIPVQAGPTIGPRTIRAYLHPATDSSTIAAIGKTQPLRITLRPGINDLKTLTIHR